MPKSIFSGHAVQITINRPHKRNAFRPRTVQELSLCFADARDDPDVGVVILTGPPPRSRRPSATQTWPARGIASQVPCCHKVSQCSNGICCCDEDDGTLRGVSAWQSGLICEPP